jgi:hypothetical protein
MSWAAQLVAALAIFAGGIAAGIKWQIGVVATRDLAAQQAALKERARQLDRIDVAATGHERDKAQIRTEFLTITQEVERVVQKPFYRDECFDDDGLQQLRAAAGGAASAGEPARAVPGLAGAGERSALDGADLVH